MRSRKILVTIVAGLLLVSFVGPMVAAARSDCKPTDFEDCTLQDWLEWLIELFKWFIAGRPDGPPPVPWCLQE